MFRIIKIVGLTLLNCILILFTVLVHKIIYRVLLLVDYGLVMYWGLFVIIFFILNFITNIIFLARK
ncbi:bacteriocin-like WGxF protein [Bacillus mycoides]|uniref:bacteriocin-like WGxF protein n=1 Tax=Bacillus cereus group TaxID=86661 RepID=UPI001A7E7CAF|nr:MULTISPECIES: bacteriocin-like WGxF protein [Bacillus cereus group]WOA63955.1 bacteriocin-like WGxF protein [Bacillus mycoides]